MLRASHISKPSTISPTMKRNLFFHVQWLQWPAVLAALFTKCFMHARQIWSKSIIGEYRDNRVTRLSLSSSFFFSSSFFVFLFFIFGQNLSTFIDGRFNPIDPSGETTSFPSRRRRFSLLFAHQRRFTSIQTRNGKKTVKKPGRNTENICNLNSPGGKRIRYFRDSVLRYLGTAAGEFQK